MLSPMRRQAGKEAKLVFLAHALMENRPYIRVTSESTPLMARSTVRGMGHIVTQATYSQSGFPTADQSSLRGLRRTKCERRVDNRVDTHS